MEQKYISKYRLLPILLIFLLILPGSRSASAFAQRRETLASFTFGTSENILWTEYAGNRGELAKLKKVMRQTLPKVMENEYHLLLLAYLPSGKASDVDALNEAFLQSNVIRSYLLSEYMVTIDHIAYYVDTVSHHQNRADVILIRRPIKTVDNTDLFYTQSDNPAVRQLNINKYAGRIPFLPKNYELGSIYGASSTVIGKRKDMGFFTFASEDAAAAVSAPENNSEAQSIKEAITGDIEKISSGEHHVMVLPHIAKAEASSAEAKRKAAVQGNKVGEYLDNEYGIGEHITYYVDTLANVSDKVTVSLVHRPILDDDNITLEPDEPITFLPEDLTVKLITSAKIDTVAVPVIVKPEKPVRVDTLPAIPLPVRVTVEKNRPAVAIKIDLFQLAGMLPNLRYSSSVIPNFGVEAYFAKRWSLSADFSMSLWSINTERVPLFRYYQACLEPRFWMFPDIGKFKWMYVGLAFQYGQFDIQDPQYSPANGGVTGRIMGAGLSLGCDFPISRHILFNIGARGGYLRIPYSDYITDRGISYRTQKHTKYMFGLQGISFSFVYRIYAK